MAVISRPSSRERLQPARLRLPIRCGKRSIVSAACVLIFSVIEVAAQTRPLPYLYLEVRNQSGILTPGPDGIITVPNNERIQARIYMRVRSVSDAFEVLTIRASNQHPEYFNNRPPPNVSLQVRQVVAQGTRDVPVRIVSSGGGKNVTLYDIDATFDILEGDEVRDKHIRGFLEWMREYLKNENRTDLTRIMTEEPYLGRAVASYNEMYINNPVGTYQITARYEPSTAENWRGVLMTDPLKIRVIFKGDFFDVMKAGAKK
jgi:hypothetical protein